MFKLLFLLLSINLYAAEKTCLDRKEAVLWDTEMWAMCTIWYDDMRTALESNMHKAGYPITQVLKRYNDENQNNLWKFIKEVVANEHKQADSNPDLTFLLFAQYEDGNLSMLHYSWTKSGFRVVKKDLPPALCSLSLYIASSNLQNRYSFKLESEAAQEVMKSKEETMKEYRN
ncbi:MAG: hypothetical protein OXC30_03305 [Alphaproteobacteria bacterium]|nr:hypothetical protein [Alphaproteobacteria bacterium]